MIFFKKTTNITLKWLLALIVANFKEILEVNPGLWACIIFGPTLGQFPWRIFLKNHEHNFTCTHNFTWLISLGKIFKKSLEQIQSSQDVPFLRLEWLTVLNKNVLQKVAIYYLPIVLLQKTLRAVIEKTKTLQNLSTPAPMIWSNS